MALRHCTDAEFRRTSWGFVARSPFAAGVSTKAVCGPCALVNWNPANLCGHLSYVCRSMGVEMLTNGRGLSSSPMQNLAFCARLQQRRLIGKQQMPSVLQTVAIGRDPLFVPGLDWWAVQIGGVFRLASPQRDCVEHQAAHEKDAAKQTQRRG
jgi:hypothetical protein